jgi:hypothetical protein
VSAPGPRRVRVWVRVRVRVFFVVGCFPALHAKDRDSDNDSDSDSDSDGDGDGDRDNDSDSHCDSDRDGDSNNDTHSDSECDSGSDSDNDSDSDSDKDSDSDSLFVSFVCLFTKALYEGSQNRCSGVARGLVGRFSRDDVFREHGFIIRGGSLLGRADYWRSDVCLAWIRLFPHAPDMSFYF